MVPHPLFAHPIFMAVGPIIASIINAWNSREIKIDPVETQKQLRDDEEFRRRMSALFPLRRPPVWRVASPLSVESDPLTVFCSVAGLNGPGAGAARSELFREEAGSRLFRLFSKGQVAGSCQFANDAWEPGKRCGTDALTALGAGFPAPYLIIEAFLQERDVDLAIAYRGGGRLTPFVYQPIGDRFPLHSLLPDRAATGSKKLLEIINHLEKQNLLDERQKKALAGSPILKAAVENGALSQSIDALVKAGLPPDCLPENFYQRTPKDDRDDAQALAAILASLAGIFVETDALFRLRRQVDPRSPWMETVLHGLDTDVAELAKKVRDEAMVEAKKRQSTWPETSPNDANGFSDPIGEAFIDMMLAGNPRAVVQAMIAAKNDMRH
jgi:hypothetical protein